MASSLSPLTTDAKHINNSEEDNCFSTGMELFNKSGGRQIQCAALWQPCHIPVGDCEELEAMQPLSCARLA